VQACGQKRDVEQWFGGGLCLCGNIALTISHAVGHERDSKGPKTQRWGGGQTIAQRRQGELEDGGNVDNGAVALDDSELCFQEARGLEGRG